MSRYIDADELRRHISKLHCSKCSNREIDEDGLCISDGDCEKYSFDWLEIDDIVEAFPGEDVVSRELFNALYEEKLELQRMLEKTQCCNSHLMDVLRELGDDGK